MKIERLNPSKPGVKIESDLKSFKGSRAVFIREQSGSKYCNFFFFFFCGNDELARAFGCNGVYRLGRRYRGGDTCVYTVKYRGMYANPKKERMKKKNEKRTYERNKKQEVSEYFTSTLDLVVPTGARLEINFHNSRRIIAIE